MNRAPPSHPPVHSHSPAADLNRALSSGQIALPSAFCGTRGTDSLAGVVFSFRDLMQSLCREKRGDTVPIPSPLLFFSPDPYRHVSRFAVRIREN